MAERKIFITLKAARTNVEMTQAELGAKLGVSALTVQSWETRKTQIPTEQLIKLCEICCVKIDDVISWLSMK